MRLDVKSTYAHHSQPIHTIPYQSARRSSCWWKEWREKTQWRFFFAPVVVAGENVKEKKPSPPPPFSFMRKKNWNSAVCRSFREALIDARGAREGMEREGREWRGKGGRDVWVRCVVPHDPPVWRTTWTCLWSCLPLSEQEEEWGSISDRPRPGLLIHSGLPSSRRLFHVFPTTEDEKAWAASVSRSLSGPIHHVTHTNTVNHSGVIAWIGRERGGRVLVIRRGRGGRGGREGREGREGRGGGREGERGERGEGDRERGTRSTSFLLPWSLSSLSHTHSLFCYSPALASRISRFFSFPGTNSTLCGSPLERGKVSSPFMVHRKVLRVWRRTMLYIAVYSPSMMMTLLGWGCCFKPSGYAGEE